MGARANIIGSTAFTPEEKDDTGNAQVYSLQSEVEIIGDTNTVAQLRFTIDDYTAAVPPVDPMFRVSLGYSGGAFVIVPGEETLGILTTDEDHLREVNDAVIFTPGPAGVLPAGMVADVPYIVQVIPASDKMIVSLTPGGSSVHYTTVGTPPMQWRGYGADSGIRLSYFNLAGGPTTPVLVKERRGGIPDDFSKIKGWQILLMPTDPALACTGQVWVQLGIPGFAPVRMGTFLVPVAINGLADTKPRAGAAFTLPVGAPYSDAYPLQLNIVQSTNLTVLLNLMGN